MFRSLARLVRAPLSKPEVPESIEEAAHAADEPAPLPAACAARFAETAALLDRLSPETARRYRMQSPALVARFGEPAFLAVSDLLLAAGRTPHVARLDEIHCRTMAALAVIAAEPGLCPGALAEALPLYRKRPLLGAMALEVLAEHPELGVPGFEAWLGRAAELCGENVVRLESFFSLNASAARAALDACLPGLALADVTGTLRHYLRALADRPFRIAAAESDDPGFALDVTSGDDSLVTLPRRVALFEERERNFILYKILAAQGAGRHLHGTYAPDPAALRMTYEATRGYFEGLGEGAGGLSHIDFAAARNTLIERVLPARPAVVTVGATLGLYPDGGVARSIFEAVESARVLARMRHAFRGVARDTETLAAPLLASRKTLQGAHLTSAAVELLFRLALVGSVGGTVEAEYAALTASLRDAIAPCLAPGATVADTLRATLDIHRLLPPPALQRDGQSAIPNNSELRMENGEVPGGVNDESQIENGDVSTDETPEGVSDDAPESAPEEMSPDADLKTLNSQFSILNYPEWDCRIGDYRADWCRVVERPLAGEGVATLPELSPGAVAIIRREFERLKPRETAWRHPFADGEDIALDAVVEHVVERRRRAVPSDRLYAARVRDRRSVSALILLDASRSTGEPITSIAGNESRRVIDCEMESLLAFGAALDHIGDRFALCAFNSRGRGDVRFFRLKNFTEPLAALPERLARLRPTDNTRLGAAVRHATRLLAREAARTKLLILLSDGMPQDGDYGDVAYAVADSARALAEARARDIKTLCVAVDAGRTDAHLTAMFGAGHFIRVGDPAELPNRLPKLYRKWTK
jgi:hypothetical protein